MDSIRKAASAEESARQAAELPREFRRHVEHDGDGGTAATGLVGRDIIRNDDDLLRLAGFDPLEWEVTPGAKRTWFKSAQGAISVFFGFQRRTDGSRAAAELLAGHFDPPTPTTVPAGTVGLPLFVALADLQTGKAGERLGGTPELVARARDILGQLVDLVAAERPSEIVVADLGDICEGTSSHTSTSQASTNDMSTSEQLRVAARLEMEYLVALSPYTPRITFAGVRSNHGEERLASGQANGHGDWGIMTGGIIRDAFDLLVPDAGERPAFVLQDPLEAGLRIEVDGMPVALTHGHYAKTLQRLPDWVAMQAGGARLSPFSDVPVVVHGHFHHFSATSSRGRLILGCPALESGSDWVAKRSGEYSDPGVLTFRVRDGRLADLRVFTPRDTPRA